MKIQEAGAVQERSTFLYWYFNPNTELDDDSTNWWGPNRPAIEAMLTVIGYKEVKLISHDAKISRMVFHAWR